MRTPPRIETGSVLGGDFFVKKQKLKSWELALLIALCITFCTGAWAQAQHEALSDALVRLHVVAASDSPEDQAEKLQMRDKVLAILSPALAGCETREEAVDIISSRLNELEALGDVTAALGTEYYPTREYSAFSLPAGEYVSLRVVIGEGAGQNWWCVVFPPLCTEALAEDDGTDAFLSLEDGQAALITQDSELYALRFRIVEWWGALAEALG